MKALKHGQNICPVCQQVLFPLQPNNTIKNTIQRKTKMKKDLWEVQLTWNQFNKESGLPIIEYLRPVRKNRKGEWVERKVKK